MGVLLVSLRANLQNGGLDVSLEFPIASSAWGERGGDTTCCLVYTVVNLLHGVHSGKGMEVMMGFKSEYLTLY